MLFALKQLYLYSICIIKRTFRQLSHVSRSETRCSVISLILHRLYGRPFRTSPFPFPHDTRKDRPWRGWRILLHPVFTPRYMRKLSESSLWNLSYIEYKYNCFSANSIIFYQYSISQVSLVEGDRVTLSLLTITCTSRSRKNLGIVIW